MLIESHYDRHRGLLTLHGLKTPARTLAALELRRSLHASADGSPLLMPSIKSRRTPPTGDERHNKRKSGHPGRQPQRVSSPPGRDLLLGIGHHRRRESQQQASKEKPQLEASDEKFLHLLRRVRNRLTDPAFHEATGGVQRRRVSGSIHDPQFHTVGSVLGGPVDNRFNQRGTDALAAS